MKYKTDHNQISRAGTDCFVTGNKAIINSH